MQQSPPQFQQPRWMPPQEQPPTRPYRRDIKIVVLIVFALAMLLQYAAGATGVIIVGLAYGSDIAYLIAFVLTFFI